jgi:hypothetical protein
MLRQWQQERQAILFYQRLNPSGNFPAFSGLAALAAGKINSHSIGVRANSLRPQS